MNQFCLEGLRACVLRLLACVLTEYFFSGERLSLSACVSEGPVHVDVQSSVLQVSAVLSVILVWLAVASGVFLLSAVCTKYYPFRENACVVLIVCTCVICAS